MQWHVSNFLKAATPTFLNSHVVVSLKHICQLKVTFDYQMSRFQVTDFQNLSTEKQTQNPLNMPMSEGSHSKTADQACTLRI